MQVQVSSTTVVHDRHAARVSENFLTRRKLYACILYVSPLVQLFHLQHGTVSMHFGV